MNEEFFKQQGDRIRLIALNADPFTKRRLLALAKTYDDGKRKSTVSLPDPRDHSRPIGSRLPLMQLKP